MFRISLTTAKWLAFIGAISCLFFLASGVIALQWIGWALSSVTCVAWAYFAYLDRDKPRCLMELCYLIAALAGVYNWIGQS
jgi:hypothetical protein